MLGACPPEEVKEPNDWGARALQKERTTVPVEQRREILRPAIRTQAGTYHRLLAQGTSAEEESSESSHHICRGWSQVYVEPEHAPGRYFEILPAACGGRTRHRYTHLEIRPRSERLSFRTSIVQSRHRQR